MSHRSGQDALNGGVVRYFLESRIPAALFPCVGKGRRVLDAHAWLLVTVRGHAAKWRSNGVAVLVPSWKSHRGDEPPASPS